ncbi:MAG: glycosyltransferase [Longimonas sp.]|uniref:glycosyltransferase n=1 Tax=Longimonas sp. TaxID=2039626 RepID=UPI003974E2A8
MGNVLAISYRFPPQTYPLAIRVDYFLRHLARSHRVRAVTSAPQAALDGVEIHRVREREANSFTRWMRRLRLQKLSDLLLWPDPFALWIGPALYTAYRLVQRERPDAIVAFAMPYSGAIVAALLKKLTGLPLIINLNDSPTCPDVNATYPSPLHAWANEAMEDWFAQTADAMVYVSKRNMERVRDRQPDQHCSTFHLIRRGVRLKDRIHQTTARAPADPVQIVYTGGLSGWYMHYDSPRTSASPLKTWLRKVWHRWNNWGKHVAAPLAPSTHTPVHVGKAVQRLIQAHPEWAGRVQVQVYGNTFPNEVVDSVLRKYDLQDIVQVHGMRPHDEALSRMHAADILFLTLPDRPDGSPGGRISAKTYEYLTTERPILAAVPPGENHDYLVDKPGVFLSRPSDVEQMAAHLEPLVAATLNEKPPTFDRTHLRTLLQSTRRAEAFAQVLDQVVPELAPPVSPDSAHVSPQEMRATPVTT